MKHKINPHGLRGKLETKIPAAFPFFFLATIAFLVSAAESDKFPGNEELRHFRAISDPRLSPDGRSVLFRITDSTADGAKSHLWLADIARNKSRQLTYSPDADKSGESQPEWFPDGNSILFLAHRGEHTQLFRLPMDGGEAQPFDIKVPPAVDASKLPDALPPPADTIPTGSKADSPSELLPVDIASFHVAPDGKRIAVIAPDPQTPGEKKQADAKADAVWVDHDPHAKRLYLFDPETNKVTPLAVPPNIQDAIWSNDGARLFVIQEEPNSASDLGPAESGWLVEMDSLKPERQNALPRTLFDGAFSTDNKSVVFLSQSPHDTPPGYADLFLYDLQTAQPARLLTDGFEGSVLDQPPVTLPGGGIVQAAGLGLRTAALSILPGHKPELLPLSVRAANSFRSNAKFTGWAFLGGGSTEPPALFYTDDLRQPARKLNTPSLVPANSRAVESRRIEWKSDGFTVEGLLYLPPEAAAQRVPLIVEVHGGPTGAYLDSYQPFVNFLVGHGWAVLRTNPRGSTNYGPTFVAANKNDLGGGDYRDIMAGVELVLKTEPVDPNRLALIGYSYGGEMAAFVEVKTARFKAIVSGAPVIDQYSEYGTEDNSWYDRWFFGKPWERAADAWRQSPLSGVAHATTPFLILQGDADDTDPPGQSKEMYRALRQMGVPVDLVTYPRDNHGLLALGIYGQPVREPWHGFDARQRIVRFIEKAFEQKAK